MIIGLPMVIALNRRMSAGRRQGRPPADPMTRLRAKAATRTSRGEAFDDPVMLDTLAPVATVPQACPMDEIDPGVMDTAFRLAGNGHADKALDLLGEAARMAPDNLPLLFALGNIAKAAGLYDEAERAFRAVLDRRPATIEAAVNLANVLVAKGDAAPATRMLTRIHALAPHLPTVALSLGAALMADDRPTEALALYDRLAGDHPDLAKVHANRGEALARLGRHAEALAAVEAAHRLLPEDAGIALNRAFALLTLGRTREGFAAYESRLAGDLPSAPLREGLTLPRWAGGSPPDGALLVVAEQGLGDEIRFAAAVSALLARGVNVVIETEPRLVALFARSFPDALVIPHDRRRVGLRPVFRYDRLDRLRPCPVAWIEAGSLPHRLRLPASEPIVPRGFLRADADRTAAFRRRFAIPGDSRRSVGLVWGSSRQSGSRRRHYPAAEAWAPILNIVGIRFVDLQYTDSRADRENFRALFGVEIEPVDDLDKRDDIEGAAALAAALDGVVGVSSSVTALAGALGVPTIEILGERSWLPMIDGRDGWLGSVCRVEADLAGQWGGAMTRAANLVAAITRGG